MPEKSTSQDLGEVVRSLFEAADRQDWDAMIAPYAPDAIWESNDGILDVAGASGVRGLLEEWAGVFEDFTVKVETVVDLGNGVVFSVYHQEGRPAGGTGVVNDRGAMIYEWVDGMIARVIVRQDIDEARAAAERLAESRGKAMSKTNVEVVRAVFEAWNAGDMDAVRELLDPGVILRHPKDHPEPGPFVGREEVMREWEQLRETWDTDLFEFVSDFSDAADRVVGRWVWRTGGRGPEASFEITSIHTLRAGKVTDIQVFWDHAEALKAAGLRE